jgi:DNA replication protein DnaC
MLKLPYLTDEEFDEVSRQADLERCPTCDATKIEVAPGVWGWENGTYRFRGEEHECDCETQMMLRKHYLAAGITPEYQTLDWADYDGPQEVRDSVSLYLARWDTAKHEGMGMTLHGTPGSGKTFAATYIGKELIKREVKVFYIPFLDVVATYQRPDHIERFEKFKTVELLILDDLMRPDFGGQTALFASKFEELLRFRTNYNKPTIITTNLTLKDIEDIYPRVASLLAAKQIEVEVDWKDARRDKIACPSHDGSDCRA